MPSYTQSLDVTLPEGIFDFVVADANEKTSQMGNDMIELQLLVKGTDGEEVRIYDNLVFAPKAFWKIDAFRVATGDVLVKGQAIEFDAEDCLDRTGKCFVIIDRYEGREKNKVKEYIDPATIKEPPQQKQQPSARPHIRASGKPTAKPSIPADDELPMH